MLIGFSDKIILLLLSLSIYFFQPEMDIHVVPVLIAVIFSAFLSYFDEDWIKAALILAFTVLCAFYNPLIFFLPLMAFDMIYYKYQYMSLFSVIPFITALNEISIQTASISAAAVFLGLWLKYRSYVNNRLKEDYLKLNDSAREMSLMLKKQNKDLLEKQDTELNLATLNERNRIAREIHDNVGHLLSSAILQSGALLTITRDEKIKEHLTTLNDTLTHAMNSIRNSVHGLYDESIDLRAKSYEIIRHFTFCEVSFDYQISSNPPMKLKYAFIAILKEALANVIKHSDATHVSVAFREHPALYQLIIKDNGTIAEKIKGSGEKREADNSPDDGMGLKNMKERVQALSGIINIMHQNGFEIFISIPKEAVQ